jgi:hypothetical protein
VTASERSSEGIHAKPLPAPASANSLYKDPQDAVKSLQEGYLYWTGKLTESSFALSLAVIGANWAVFGSVDRVFGNPWSEVSIAVVILSLVLNLFGNWKLGGMLRKQIAYAEEDPQRWEAEFKKASGISSPWPSTPKIDRSAITLRWLRTFLPTLGGACFLVALFIHPKVVSKNESQSAINAVKPTITQSATPLGSPIPRIRP